MAGQLTIDTLKASTGVLATQNGMTGIAKAWVNFNGSSTPTIRNSFNVSSITYNATGDYTVNFTTATPDINYAPVVCCSSYYIGAINTISATGVIQAPTTSAFRINTGAYSVGGFATTYVSVAVFGA